MTVYFLPLEPYEERYTLQLRDWTLARFAQKAVDVICVEGDSLTTKITTGVALDAYGRSYYALTQTAKMVRLMQSGQVKDGDVIYNQDLFHPGWEAVPYILDQTGSKVRTFTHLLAQTIDPQDFTFPMRHWMRPYESMIDKSITGIFVAADCMVDMMNAAMFTAPIYKVGLLFDKNEVRSRVPVIKPWNQRSRRIVYTSRWDREKQPWFFLELVKRAKADLLLGTYEFSILTGAERLRSNMPEMVAEAYRLRDLGLLTIYEGLKKTNYYELLADSQLQFNCAKQDFISNTLNESSALGTPSLLPAYMSFPEAVNNDPRMLYVPWSVEDALEKMKRVLEQPPLDAVSYSADVQHKTLDKVIDIMTGAK